jgi:cell wall-associated NlpC family hydrolase
MGLVRLATMVLATAVMAACASSGAVPKPFPGSPAPPSSAAPGSPRRDAASIVNDALALRGVPYRNGGSDLNGFDCSGFVQYVFAKHGVTLPRATREQLEHGTEVRLAGIAPGDLIFFSTTASKEASHVGVAIGGDEFVHAPSSRGVVRVEKFSAPYWSRRIIGVRRIR